MPGPTTAPGPDPRAALIASMARARGLDPAAVLSIASVEGGFNGSVGDNGTSFGPFQLHQGGALPAQYNGNPQAANAFANSPAGIQYAENAIQKVAAGKTGQAAIQAISSQFERPADVAGEVAKASARYGQYGSGSIPSTAPSGDFAIQGQPAGGRVSAAPNILAAMQLLAQGQSGETNPVMQLALSRMQAGAAQQAYGPAANPSAKLTSPGGQSGIVGIGGGATPLGSNIVRTALTQLGQPYQYGGEAKLGNHTDCSGLVQAVYQANGIAVPRTSYEQWKVGTPVDPKDLQPGDELFFNMTSSGPEHVGLYAGNGKFIEDPHTGASVTVKDLASYPGFVGARRPSTPPKA